jgi:hypothetical protein
MNHIRKYYTLLERSEAGWHIAFGDYKRHIVDYELNELYYNYKIDNLGKRKAKRLKKAELFKIITTAPDQESINRAVASENFLLKVQNPVEGV